MIKYDLIWLISGLGVLEIDFWWIYSYFWKTSRFSEKTSTFLKKLRNPVKLVLRTWLFFFYQLIYQKTRKKITQVIGERILDSWVFLEIGCSFFRKLILGPISQHFYTYQNPINQMFVFTLLLHILISWKAKNKIKDRYLH